MRRWTVPVSCAVVSCVVLAAGLVACTPAPSKGNSIADMVLRVGEDVGTEVETFEGQMAPGLDAALNADNPNAKERVALPKPPGASLSGSGRVARADGSTTFFVMYEVKTAEPAVSEAMHELVDTTPWQVVGGQSNEGVSAFNFQNTRNPGISGSVVVQPLPTTDRFDVVVSRDGKNKSLGLHRRSFVPVLGAEFQEKDGGLMVSRVVPGEAAVSGLQEGDRVVSVAGKDVRDEAALQAALRSLSGGSNALTSVIYIVRVAPDVPLRSVFSAPPERALPKAFPAPFLVLQGTTPIAVRWTTGTQGAVYEVTLLTRQSPGETLRAYRQVLADRRMTITGDTAQGSATTLSFGAADGSLAGSLSVDTFEQDDSYTVVSLQLQSQRGGAAAPRPGASPGGPPSGSATPAVPSSTAAPTGTARP